MTGNADRKQPRGVLLHGVIAAGPKPPEEENNQKNYKNKSQEEPVNEIKEWRAAC